MIWNPATERMTRAAREALQWERLRATLAWATERVPFYAERLRGRAVRGLGELATLPFTRKSDLREHYPFGLFAVPRAELARLHASSGTKGKPTVVGYTAGDLDIWREVMARVLVSYPDVRYILPDRISLEPTADPRTLETVARFLERQQWLVTSVVVE